MQVENAGISRGVYAPGITYNPHNETFYMITTVVNGLGNIIVKTKYPMDGWSDPIKLDFGGIDPSIFFDEDGARLMSYTTMHPIKEKNCIAVIE